MNINRNNYEEFFLLYVDNELSASDRIAVELFTEQHPDLQEELLMLQQTVLNPSLITFEEKEALLKPDAVLQQKLLLHLDNELEVDHKKQIELLIGTDATAAAEWALLQQIKLEPDTAVNFTDKHLLYRKEPSKVISMRWWKIAAAAILIGFGTWGTIALLQHKKSAGEDVVKNQPGEEKKVSPVMPSPKQSDNSIADQKITQDIVSPVEPKQILVNNNNTEKNLQSLPIKKAMDNIQSVPDQKKDAIAVQDNTDKKPTNNLPTPLQNINRSERNILNSIAVTPIEHSNQAIPDKRDAVSNKQIEDAGKTNNIIAASFNPAESGTAEPDDEPDGKKSKLRGLFRKVKRVFEKNTNSASGSSVKIAGFDVAIK
ncbi:MAG: hypothetical protein ABJA78_08060 [Ferruginibacter sp.]